MMRFRPSAVLLCIVAASTGLAAGAAPTVRVIEHGRFGSLQVLVPEGKAAGMALFLSRVSGWDATVEHFAQALAARGIVVAALDSGRYLQSLRQRQKGCHYLAADFEDLAHRVAREAGMADYSAPVVVGVGAGATLARLGEMQAPAGSFAGALGLEPVASLEFGNAALCSGPRGALKVAAGPHGEVRPDAAIGAGETYATVPVARLAEAPAALAAAVEHTLAAAHPAPAASVPADVQDLPIIEIPVQTPVKTLALMLSGDGGWAGIDKEVGAQLAGRGVPVVGVSTLKYFWKRRSPDEAAADMARALRHYLAAWKAERIVLVGYSFGADVMPFIVTRLPADLRARIASVNLLALGAKADFEIHVTGWVGGSGRDALPIAPELARLGELRRLCFYGDGDKESAASCAGFTGPRAAARKVGDGHHFGYLYSEIADFIVDYAGR